MGVTCFVFPLNFRWGRRRLVQGERQNGQAGNVRRLKVTVNFAEKKSLLPNFLTEICEDEGAEMAKGPLVLKQERGCNFMWPDVANPVTRSFSQSYPVS